MRANQQLTNLGTIESGTSSRTLSVTTDLVNEGTLIARDGGRLKLPATFEQTGDLRVGSLGRVVHPGTYRQLAGELILKGGTLEAGTVSLEGGSLRGFGTVDGALINHTLIEIGEGSDFGRVVVTGDYTQAADAALNIRLGGTEAGAEHDVLEVNGTAVLGGLLDVAVVDGFIPLEGDVFRVVEYGDLEGLFAEVRGIEQAFGRSFDLRYGLAGLTLETVVDADAGPLVVTSSPAGLWNEPVTRLELRFDKPIDPASFTVDDVHFTGPQGAVDPQQMAIEQVDVLSFAVVLPEVHVDGDYTFVIGPTITDPNGNELQVQHVGRFTLDLTGPRVTSGQPMGEVDPPLSRFEVTFSEPIDASTFTTDDAVLVRPDGSEVAAVWIVALADDRFEVRFNDQHVHGTYTLRIGPNIRDLAGNAMDQLQDGAHGTEADVFSMDVDVRAVDLTVQDLAVTAEPGFESGAAVTVSWANVNIGSGTTGASWHDRVTVVHEDTGETLLDQVLAYDADQLGALGPGEQRHRQFTFELPDGPAGVGQWEVRVTVDAFGAIPEHNEEGTSAQNNIAKREMTTTLADYPDLVLSALEVGPTALHSGQEVEVTWTVSNEGEAAVAVDWDDRVLVRNLDTGQLLVSELHPYEGSLQPLAPGQTVQRSAIVRLPDGEAGVGQIEFEVIADAGDRVFEHNAEGTAADNNAASTVVTSSLAPYPDLAIAELTWPDAIDDGATVPLRAWITNTGPVAAGGFDVRFEIGGEAIGQQRIEELAAGASIEVVQEWIATPGVHELRVIADPAGEVFELDEDNNVLSATLPLIIDTTPPQMIHLHPVSGLRIGASTTLSALAEDNVGVSDYVFEYSADGEVWAALGSNASGELTWDTTALEDGPYWVRITAQDAAGNVSEPLVQQYVVDNTPPEAVTLTGEGIEFSAALSWAASPSADTSHYRVFRSIEAGGAYEPVSGALTQTTFVDSQVEPGETYHYVVAAFDQVGNRSAFSNEVVISPLGDVTPPQVLWMQPGADYRSATVIELSASATDNVGVVAYAFEYRPAGETDWQSIGEGPSVTWDVSGLPGGDYVVRVTAYDAAGNAGSMERNYRVNHEAPATPEALRIRPEEGALVVAWNAVVAADFDHYELSRIEDGGAWTVLIPQTTSTVHIDADVALGRSYGYRVVAVDDLGNRSEPTEVLWGEPLADTTAPTVQAISPAEGTRFREQITLRATAWDNVQVEQLHFEAALLGTGDFELIGTDASPQRVVDNRWEGTVTWDAAGLPDGIYVVQVTAVDGAGHTASAEQTYTIDRQPPAAPSAPVVENPRRGGTLDLSWIANTETDLAGYNIYRSTYPAADGALVGSTGVPSFRDVGLEDGVSYFYRITAVDQAGNESGASPLGSNVATAEADLSVETIHVEPASPVLGRATQVRVGIANAGPASAEAVVYLYLDGPEGQLLATQTIGLAAGQMDEVAFSWTPQEAGEQRLTAVLGDVTPVDVNPDNQQADLDVIVNIPPVAVAGEPREGDWNTAIAFDAAASHDADGVIVGYHWDFGDGASSERAATTHAYQEPGTYLATLTVTDNRGATAADTVEVVVHDTRADLVVSDVTWTPLDPQERDELTITGTIANMGNGPTGQGFFVGFYIDGQYRGYQRINELLAPGDSVEVAFNWTATKGQHTLEVVADDIQNNVIEIDETNNRRQVTLTLQQTYFPDLAIENLAVDLNGTVVSSQQPIEATATLVNDGTADAADFWVTLYLGEEMVTRQHVAHLGAGTSRELTFHFLPRAGEQTLRVVADGPVSRVVELNKANNEQTLPLPALELLYPDLEVTDVTVHPDQSVVSDGTLLDIAATIRNSSDVPVDQRFEVSFYLNGEFIGSRELSHLGANATRTVTMKTPATPGSHVATVVVDEAGAVLEADRSNNSLAVDVPELTILYPDLVVSDVQFAPVDPKYGDTVYFTATVSNLSAVTTLDTFVFALYMNGDTIAVQELPRLTGHASHTFALPWRVDVEPGVGHTLTAAVDIHNQVREENEDNNQLTVADGTFYVGDNFVLSVDTPGAGLDEFGLLVYTSRQVAEMVATVTRGSFAGQPVGPQTGLETLVSVSRDGQSILDDEPMTFRAADGTFHASIDLMDFGTGNYTVSITATDGVDTATKMLVLTVIEEVNFSLTTDRDVYLRGEPITITGQLETLGGEPMPFAQVHLLVGEGTQAVPGLGLVGSLFDQNTRRFTTFTDAWGNFSHTFHPLRGDVGTFNVEAFTTSRTVGTSGYAEFSILAADLTPRRMSVETITNQTFRKTLTLRNPSDDPLHGGTVTVIDDTGNGVPVTLSAAIPDALLPGASVPLRLEWQIPEDAPDTASYRIRFESVEGVAEEATISFRFREAVPAPRFDRSEVQVAVRPGERLTTQMTLTNTGLGTMAAIDLVPPQILPWVSLSAPAKDTLAPGEVTTIDITVSPPAELSPGLYADRIVASDGTSHAEMILSVEVSTAQIGTVVFAVVNDIGEAVPNAEIRLVGQDELLAVFGDGTTASYRNTLFATSDHQGFATFENISIGKYDYSIAAPGHKRLDGSLQVMPQTERQIAAVTMTAAPLTYTWTVEPVIIEDRYEITLDLDFATDIPKPQFVFLPPWVTVPHEMQAPRSDQLIIVNPNLIELQDVTVEVVGVDGVTVFSFGDIGDMAPQSTATVGFGIAEGDYEVLDGRTTYFRVLGRYVQFDPQTNERIADGEIEGKIPLVNPSPARAQVRHGDLTLSINLPVGADEELPNFPNLPPRPSEGVREVVSLRIDQTATLEREGFDARLELTNGRHEPLTGLSIHPRVMDDQGRDVTDRFFIVPPDLSGIGAVDGSQSLPALASMDGRWILIPGDGLGGTELSGQSYWVRAVMTYYVDGRLRQTQTNAVEITVHPQPELHLHYYVPEQVQAGEPFRLGLWVENAGHGVARNLTIDSAQPRIVENESGLLVDFAIIDSSFGGHDGDTFRLALGDIGPQDTAHGYWLMTSTLDGAFVDFSAEMTHLSYRGIDLNPLIREVSTHIIQQDGLFPDADDPDDAYSLIDRNGDGFPDYLINFSTGLRLPVETPDNITITRPVTDQDRTMDLVVPETAGYAVIMLPDPVPDANVRGVLRRGADADSGVSLSGGNFWRDGGLLYIVDRLGHIDADGIHQPQSATYTVDFRSALKLEDLQVIPTEFSIIYSGDIEGSVLTNLGAYTINAPDGDSLLTTYELNEPLFFLDLPPTEGQRAAIGASVRNAGAAPESVAMEVRILQPDGTEVLLDVIAIDEMRGFGTETIITSWTPLSWGEHTVTVRLLSDAPESELSLPLWVNALPMAHAGGDFTSSVGQPTRFDANRSWNPDGFIHSYTWDMGDGHWIGGMTPIHVYDAAGTYEVRVIVRDDIGAMSEDTVVVTIEDARPDLIVSHIETMPSTPAEGEEVTVIGTVRNIGQGAVEEAFYVGFYVNGHYHASVRIPDPIGPGEEKDVLFTWSAKPGNRLFTIVANDLDNRVDEVNRDNNSLTVALNPEQMHFPDLTVDQITLSVEEGEQVPWGDPVTITADVKNIGTAPAGRFRVNFYADGVFLGYTTIDALSATPGENMAPATLQWVPTSGVRKLTVTVDEPLNHIVELNEDNNRLSVAMPVIEFIYPQLTVTDFSVWPPDGRVQAGQPAIVYASIRNQSEVDLPVPVPVSLYIGQHQVATAVLDGLAGGAEATLQFKWFAVDGTADLTLRIDPKQPVPEEITLHGTATIPDFTIKTLVPDLVIGDVVLLDEPRVGETVTLGIRIDNQGSGYTGTPFNVGLWINDHLIDVRRITRNLMGGSNTYWFVPWEVEAAEGGQFTVRVTADVHNEVSELSVTNNTRIETFDVLPSYDVVLRPTQEVWLSGEPLELEVEVRDPHSPAAPLGPGDDVSVQVQIRDDDGQVVWSATAAFDAAAGHYAVGVDTGALEAGAYLAEALVTGPRQSRTVASPLVIAEDFSLSLATDRSMYGPGDTVRITGEVETRDLSRIAGEAVSLTLMHGGTVRRFESPISSEGTFSYEFTPLRGERGTFTVEAEATIGGLTRIRSVEASVEGLLIEPEHPAFVMSDGASQQLLLHVTNSGTAVQEQIALAVTGALPDHLVAEFDTSSLPASLAPGEAAEVTVLLISDSFIGDAVLNLAATSTAAGQTFDTALSLHVAVHAAVPQYAADPKRLDIGVLPGVTIDRTITVTNAGYAPMTDLVVGEPSLPWVDVISRGDATLAPGQSTELVVRITAHAAASPGAYGDALSIISNAGELRIPIHIEVASSSLPVTEMAFAVDNHLGLDVPGATLMLWLEESLFAASITRDQLDRYRNVVATADGEGQVDVELLAGRYIYTVMAPGHEPDSGTIEIDPRLSRGEHRFTLQLNPLALSIGHEVSSEPMNLGQVQLGLVMHDGQRGPLVTDRPGAEYLVLPDGVPYGPTAPGDLNLEYLRIGGGGRDNQSFSINNTSGGSVDGVTLSVHGDIAPYLRLSSSNVGQIPAGGSAIVGYALFDIEFLEPDQIVDGHIEIKSQEHLLKFPVRIRIAEQPHEHDAAPYRYVAYRGPWPTGPVVYGEDFIDRWFEGIAFNGVRATGHSLSNLRLSQDVIAEGDATLLTLSVKNILDERALAIADGRITITAPDGSDVTRHFDITPLMSLGSDLAPAAETVAQWRIRPESGHELGGTGPAGVAYRVDIDIHYEIAGQPGVVAAASQVITVRPQPRLDVRYEVRPVPDAADQVDVKLTVTNSGFGAAEGLRVALPTLDGVAYTLVPTAPRGDAELSGSSLLFHDVAPDETVDGYWRLQLPGPVDIGAIATQLIPAQTSWSRGDLVLGAPVDHVFVSQHTVEDVQRLLGELLEVSKTKIENELQRLGQHYHSLQGLVQEHQDLIAGELDALLMNSRARMITTIHSLFSGMTKMVKILATGFPIDGVFAPVKIGFALGAIAAEPHRVMAYYALARSQQAELEELFNALGEGFIAGEFNADDYVSMLSESINYGRFSPTLLWEELQRLEADLTHDQSVRMLDEVVKQGSVGSQGGLAPLFAELDHLYEEAIGMLSFPKATAIFPVDVLHEQLSRLISVMKRLERGTGAPESAREQVRHDARWYSVGERHQWLPVFQQQWEFGALQGSYLNLLKWESIQWDNFAQHWGIISEVHNVALVGASVSMIPLPEPDGLLWNQGVAKPWWDRLLASYTDALESMRQAEMMTYEVINRYSNEFMLTHIQETAGVWQMFSDFGNHLAYILEENPIDPEVSVHVDSMGFITPAVSDAGSAGLTLGNFVVTNTSEFDLRIRPVISVTAGEQSYGMLHATEIALAPGESGRTGAVMLLPKSILTGASGYEVEVTFDAYDPVTLSRAAIGPYYGHLYVGTDEQLMWLNQQQHSHLLGGPVGQETRFQRKVELDQDTERFRLLLIHAPDTDFDLHLYDEQGRHVGHSAVLDVDEIEIPGASYNGSDSRWQVIEVAGGESRTYTVEVRVNDASPTDRFEVAMLETPRFPALLATSTERIRIVTDDPELNFTLDALEWGGFTGVVDIEAELGAFTDGDGVEIVLGGSNVDLAETMIAAGDVRGLTVQLSFDPDALDDTYLGDLVIRGRDALSDKELSRRVAIEIELDRQPPEPPQLMAVEEPAKVASVPIHGTAEPMARIAFYLDEQLVGQTSADAEGEFEFFLVPPGIGDFVVTARATDEAGNESGLSQPLTITSLVDPVAPNTRATLAGEEAESGWFRSDVWITLSAEDPGGSGVEQTWYAIGDGPWRIYEEPVLISEEGTTRVRYRSTDAAGNEEVSRVIHANIDRTPPVSAVHALPAFTNSADIRVEWSGRDDAMGVPGSGIARYDVFVSEDGGPWTEWKSGTSQTLGIFNGEEGTSYAFYSQATDHAGNVEEKAPVAEASTTVQLEAAVLGRHVFYYGSGFDAGDPGPGPHNDDAIASDKQALLPGEVADSMHLTGYTDGINGVMIDIAGLVDPAAVDFADFALRVGTNDDPTTWSAAPDPLHLSVREGDGIDGSDRVEIIWADNAIQDTWLQITILATDNTGLAEPDVFYFGNLRGDTNGDGVVNNVDLLRVTLNMRKAADDPTINLATDLTGDGLVTAADREVVRDNYHKTLPMISVPVEEWMSESSDPLVAEALSADTSSSLSALSAGSEAMFVRPRGPAIPLGTPIAPSKATESRPVYGPMPIIAAQSAPPASLRAASVAPADLRAAGVAVPARPLPDAMFSAPAIRPGTGLPGGILGFDEDDDEDANLISAVPGGLLGLWSEDV
ncbi:MAG: PKD domain-containing protein [Phycisphaeraceae bacterium]|nr:PKD domain-containing protein [Phycisphaeraceae bacterium]